MTGLNFQTETIVNKADQILKGNRIIINGFEVLKDNVVALENKAPVAAVMGNVSVSIPATADKYYRLDIKIGVEGAEPFIYSNAMAKKYIPFSIEFKGNTSAANVKKMINKHQLLMLGEAVLEVGVGAESSKLVLNCVNENQRVLSAELFDITNDEPVKYTSQPTKVTGTSSFGSYSYLINNLRLPTIENTRWLAPKNETPEVGANYHQFIITYKAPASNGGLHAVGQRMESETTHVVWVKESLTAVISALTALGAESTSEASVLND